MLLRLALIASLWRYAAVPIHYRRLLLLLLHGHRLLDIASGMMLLHHWVLHLLRCLLILRLLHLRVLLLHRRLRLVVLLLRMRRHLLLRRRRVDLLLLLGWLPVVGSSSFKVGVA